MKEIIMETEVATAAGSAAASNGSLAGVTTAAKAFLLAHPLGVAVAGGALLGMGTYWAFGKVFGKKKSIAPAVATA
jgi:hypothetical protein